MTITCRTLYIFYLVGAYNVPHTKLQLLLFTTCSTSVRLLLSNCEDLGLRHP